MQAALQPVPACARISVRRDARGVLRAQAVPGVPGHAPAFVGIAARVIVQGTVMDVADVLLRAKITVKEHAILNVFHVQEVVIMSALALVKTDAKVIAHLAMGVKAVLVRKIQ